MMDGCPRLKMGYESCDAPLCNCPRVARTLSITDQEVEKVARAIWAEDFYDSKLCGGCGGDGCAYCEPHEDELSEWATDHEKMTRMARAAILALREGVEEVPYCGIVVVPEGE